MQKYGIILHSGAEKLAEQCGIEKCKISQKHSGSHEFSTVGVAVLDKNGNLASAVSTGGMKGKHPGRVWDSAIVGSGFYADKNSASVATGNGDVNDEIPHYQTVLRSDFKKALIHNQLRILSLTS